jgi:uncharacterized protein YndB with AHSA1/START domain
MSNNSRAATAVSFVLTCATAIACSDTETNADGADRLEINTGARTVASASLEIEAPPSAVWAVLVDVDRWTEWLPFQSAHLDGPLAVNSIIRWSVTGEPIDSRIVLVEPSRRLVWNGTDGAVHVWRLEPSGDGTLLKNSESIDDWQADRSENSSANLEMTLEDWNQALSQRVRSIGSAG